MPKAFTYDVIIRNFHTDQNTATDLTRRLPEHSIDVWYDPNARITDLDAARKSSDVMLIIRNDDDTIRWRNITTGLGSPRAAGKTEIKQLEFIGEPFNIASIRRWAAKLTSP